MDPYPSKAVDIDIDIDSILTSTSLAILYQDYLIA